MNRREFFALLQASMFGALCWRRNCLLPITIPPKPTNYPPDHTYVGRSHEGYIIWDPPTQGAKGAVGRQGPQGDPGAPAYVTRLWPVHAVGERRH